jgi:AbrB family looped-hinge helix DNA binding protein
MNLTKFSANGQITLPYAIRDALKLKEGDKISFSQKENGEIVITNSTLTAIQEAQESLKDCNYVEEEILADVMELRYGTNAK